MALHALSTRLPPQPPRSQGVGRLRLRLRLGLRQQGRGYHGRAGARGAEGGVDGGAAGLLWLRLLWMYLLWIYLLWQEEAAV